MALSIVPRQIFVGTCAAGGKWYACTTGSMFVGCCTTESFECDDGCSAGNLASVTFNKDDYGTFPDPSCGQSALPYTCADNTPPFWGCCKSNPCTQGECPDGDLVGAFLDKPEQMTAYATFTSTRSSASFSTGVATVPKPSTTTSSSSATSTLTPTPKSNHTAAIAGGAACGVLVLCLLVGIILFLFRRRRSHSIAEGSVSNVAPAMATDNPGYISYADAPPLYASPHLGKVQNVYAFGESPTSPPVGFYATELETPANRHPHTSHRLSELSGNPSSRSELESPTTSPNLNVYSPPATPMWDQPALVTK